jgi:hypothetical protein
MVYKLNAHGTACYSVDREMLMGDRTICSTDHRALFWNVALGCLFVGAPSQNQRQTLQDASCTKTCALPHNSLLSPDSISASKMSTVLDMSDCLLFRDSTQSLRSATSNQRDHGNTEVRY